MAKNLLPCGKSNSTHPHRHLLYIVRNDEVGLYASTERVQHFEIVRAKRTYDDIVKRGAELEAMLLSIGPEFDCAWLIGHDGNLDRVAGTGLLRDEGSSEKKSTAREELLRML